MDTTNKPDFIRIADLRINKLEAKVDELFPRSVFGLDNFERTVDISFDIEGTHKTAEAVRALRNEYVDLYIVRKGPQSAALGMALIKDAFGQSEELREEYGEQVRDIIGKRMLTKETDEAAKYEGQDARFDFGLNGDVNTLVVSGYLPTEARKVRALYEVGGAVKIFEDLEGRRTFTVGSGGPAFFDKSYFAAERVREATPEQIREYLILKFEYENDKN